jgi:hypothetical protein
MTRGQLWRGAAQILVLGVVLVFWGQAVLGNWSQLAAVTWRADVPLLLASAVLALAHLPLTALIWRRALGYLSLSVTPRWATRAYLIAQLGRYVPGGVWDVAGRVYLASERGLPRGPVSVTILVEMVLGVVTGALIFLLSLAWWDRVVPPEALAVSLAFAALGLASLHPSILGPVLNLAARLLKRETALLPFTYRQVLLLALWHFLVRLTIGLAFYLFAAALTPLDLRLMPVMAGIFVAAWVMGFVVIIAPQGLGVREGVMVFLMSFYMPVAVASVIAVAFRLWLSLRDLAMAAIGSRL